MQDNLQRLLEFFASPKHLLSAAVSGGLLFALLVLISDFAVIGGNEGSIHLVVYVFLNVILALLFGAYFSLFLHKIREKRAAASVSGALGTGASVMVTGCAGCSFTLAGFLGLGGFVGLMPFGGLEFTILGILLLLFSVKKLTDPAVCKTR